MKRLLPYHKPFFVLLLLLCAAGMNKGFAFGFQQVYSGKTFYFNIIDATNHYVEITYPGTSTSNPWEGYTKPTGNITLPSTITYNGVTYTVTAIGAAAFSGCSGLTGGLVIPNTVTTIGEGAFVYCIGFTGSLTIPNSVTEIGQGSFYYCNGFTGSLTIPNSVTMIGPMAFSSCSGFMQVKFNAVNCADALYDNGTFNGCGGTLTIGSSVQRIPAYMFYGCDGFTGSLTIPNSVTSIGEAAFYNCSGFTGSLTLGSSVTEIEDGAFYGCSSFTGTLTIPNAVTTIGFVAFYGCSGFTQVNFNAINCADALYENGTFNGCGGMLTIGSSVQRIPAYMFYGCDGFTGSLTIPNTVTEIGEAAFYNCSGFTGSLTFGSSVTEIEDGAFYGCSGFTGNLTLGNSVTTIGNATFRYCSGFTGSLTIPNAVTTIGTIAFQGCSGFSQVNYNAVNCADVFFGSLPFDGCGGMLTIGSSVQRIPAYMFYGCAGFTGSLAIPNSVTEIGEAAFYNCSGFTGNLTLGNSVTTIGEGAFRYCSGFTGPLTIPNTVTTIGTIAFQGCSGFSQVNFNAVNCADVFFGSLPFDGCGGTLTIGSSVQRIPAYMFYGCAGFTGSLAIPNSVTEIGEAAFYNCSGFTGNLTLGNSVTTIGEVAFRYCSGFTGSLTIPNTVTTIGTIAFQGCSGFSQVNYNAVNCADVYSGSLPFDGCGGTLTIGSSVQRIPAYMFYECDGFTGSLTIPNSVTSIGEAAFYNCSGFTGSLTIGNSVTTIGTAAFMGCRNFTGSLTLGNSLTEINTVAFDGCSGFTGSLNIPNSVTMIGPMAFSDCSGFTQVNYNAVNCADAFSGSNPFDGCGGTLTIGDSVQRIPASMFLGCHGFTGSLTIPNSVTTIGKEAFMFCDGFTGSLNLGNSLTEIGKSAFCDCDGFTGSLTIPNSVTTIDTAAFYGCSGFTGSLTIGNSVTTIGTAAFVLCSHINDMTIYPVTPPTIDNSFASMSPDIPVYVPCASLEDYQTAPGWSVFTNIQCIPETLTVYDGTTTSYYVPAYILYFDDFTRSQFVIPADDLAEMIGTPITSMTFYTTSSNVPYTTVSSADVYLKEVSYTTISAYVPKASATTVYSGCFDIVSTSSGGEMTIHFNAPFTYNGGNLLVGIENTEDSGWKRISFYGQTVTGASIAGYNANGLESVSPTQRDFIPKTTFSFIPSHEAKSLPYTYGFEEADEFGYWTMLNCGASSGRTTFSHHDGGYSFQFFYNTNPPQYLISPKFEGTTGMDVSFYYINDWDQYPETFQVGYSTTTKSPNAFEWGPVMTAQDQNTWMLYEETFPEGTKYVAVKYLSYDQDVLYLDDFSFVPAFCPPEDRCELTFTLTDSYGDGWNGNAINVVDVETGIVLDTMTNQNLDGTNGVETQTFTLAVCDGRELRFEWVSGSWSYECSYTVTDSNGNEIFSGSGAMSAPVTYTVNCSGGQTIALSAGWNWVSTYIDTNEVDCLSMLEAALGENATQIKSADSYTDYYDGYGWYGPLDEIGMSNQQMYMVMTNTACSVTLEGPAVNPADVAITLNPEWNWIGFPIDHNMTPDEAFANFTPSDLDVIKGGEDYWTYYEGFGWYSETAEYMVSGRGYMYYSNSATSKTLVFSTGTKHRISHYL